MRLLPPISICEINSDGSARLENNISSLSGTHGKKYLFKIQLFLYVTQIAVRSDINS